MNETTNSEQVKAETKHSFEGIVHEVMELGTTWVRYGLTVGETALRTSAQSLSGVANVLHKVADQVQARATDKPAEPPKAETPAN